MEQNIEVPANWESITHLMAFSDALECHLELSEEQKYLLRLAIEEIATNIIKYGYDNGSYGIIQLGCSCTDGVLRVVIRDQGRPFDPYEVPAPDLCENLEQRVVGGLGVFLVRELADDLSYSHDTSSGWNELVIVKGREDV
jgi:anti-sigma regulatory factor (Ser/Thr protein kinase)